MDGAFEDGGTDAGSCGARFNDAGGGSFVVRQLADGPSSLAQAPRVRARPSATKSFGLAILHPIIARAVSLTMLI
jgi:hypothetical protein